MAVRQWLVLGGLGLAATGCWKLPEEYPELPNALTLFEPDLPAPEGWLVSSHAFPLGTRCPDGENARAYLLYPESAVAAPAIAGAVLYHSGAFDFVFAPEPGDPLDGTHYASPGRLDHEWPIRHVFATLGLLPNEISTEIHVGSLAIALAENNVAVLLPTNCWGDMWHNRAGADPNDFTGDKFHRSGRAVAEWAYQFMVDPVFAQAFGVEFPVGIRPDEVYVIGLGEGGRAIAELLHTDLPPEDGVPDFVPAGVLVDSYAEDLGIYFEQMAGDTSMLTGLDRIFPGGLEEVERTSLFSASLPDRFGYLYSDRDPEVPTAAHGRMVELLTGDTTRWLGVESEPRHVLLNTANMEPAREAVKYLVSGIKPN